MTEQRESEMKRRSVRRSQSGEMKKQREREMEKRSVRSRQSVQTSRVGAENNTTSTNFIAMSSEFTFGDNSEEFTYHFPIFLNLADSVITEYQITQTLTLSWLRAHLERTRGIKLFTHTTR